LHQFNLGRQLWILSAIRGEKVRPLLSGLCPTRADAVGKVLIDAVGYKKRGVCGPAVELFSEANLLLTQRLAVGRCSILFVRGAVADVAVQHDERGAVFGLAKNIKGMLDALNIVGVADAQDIPAVRQKSRRDILSKGDARFPLDRDVIVVVDPA